MKYPFLLRTLVAMLAGTIVSCTTHHTHIIEVPPPKPPVVTPKPKPKPKPTPKPEPAPTAVQVGESPFGFKPVSNVD